MKKLFSIAYQNREASLSAERQFAYALAAGFTETAFSLAEGATVRPEDLLAARKARMRISAIRLPTDSINLLWEIHEIPEEKEARLPSDQLTLDDCTWDALCGIYASYFTFLAKVGIPYAVLVPSVGTELPQPSAVGLSRFRELGALAEEKGIHLLIENDESAPHFEAVVRVLCESGFHGVSFCPAKAWKHFGTSALPSYARTHLSQVLLDDIKDDAFGYLPGEGEADYRAFAESVADMHFRGTLLISPYTDLALYSGLDYFSFASRAYDAVCDIQRLMKRAEGVV